MIHGVKDVATGTELGFRHQSMNDDFGTALIITLAHPLAKDETTKVGKEETLKLNGQCLFVCAIMCICVYVRAYVFMGGRADMCANIYGLLCTCGC